MEKVYFAGPLFCRGEDDFNFKIVEILERFDYQVFLPKRDGIEAKELDCSFQEKNERIFKKDISEIDNADIFFMILDGRIPDEGACVELGYAFAKNKRCYGLRTDSRCFMNGLNLNPMLTGCFKVIFEDNEDKKAEMLLFEFLEKNRI